MKNILTLSSLAIAGGVVAASVAELAGGSAPAIVNAPVAMSAFVLVLSALLLLGDYGRPARRLVVESAAPVAATPARRNGYSIRRGAEAARLANPPANIAVFPKTRVRSCDRAA